MEPGLLVMTTAARRAGDERDLVADCHGDDAHRAEEGVLVVGAPAGHEHRDNRERRYRHEVEQAHRHIGEDHPRAKGDDGEDEHRRGDEEDRRDVHHHAVRFRRRKRFLCQELDGVGDWLEETEGAGAVRAVARLHPADDLAFAVDADIELGREHEDEEARDEADERREHVDDPEGKDFVGAIKDGVGQVREVAKVVPVICSEEDSGHQRSISPTTISIEPRTTMASASVPPTVISLSAERLIKDGGRMWKR